MYLFPINAHLPDNVMILYEETSHYLLPHQFPAGVSSLPCELVLDTTQMKKIKMLTTPCIFLSPSRFPSSGPFFSTSVVSSGFLGEYFNDEFQRHSMLRL